MKHTSMIAKLAGQKAGDDVLAKLAGTVRTGDYEALSAFLVALFGRVFSMLDGAIGREFVDVVVEGLRTGIAAGRQMVDNDKARTPTAANDAEKPA